MTKKDCVVGLIKGISGVNQNNPLPLFFAMLVLHIIYSINYSFYHITN